MRRPVRCSLAAVVVCVTALAGTATAATPPDLSTDPVVRAGWVTIQATYAVRVRIEAEAMRVGGRRIALADVRADREGAAVGVSTAGVLATAAHLVDPTPAAAAAELLAAAGRPAPTPRPSEWTRSGAGLDGLRVTVTVALVRPDLVASDFQPARVTGTSDRGVDVAVLRIDDRAGPAAPFARLPAAGSDVAVVALGPRDGRVPGIASLVTGRLGGRITDVATGRRLRVVEAAVGAGDSGGPVVNARGEVVGLVSEWVPDARRGLIADADDVRTVVRRAGFDPVQAASTGEFRETMRRVWSFDLDAARARLLSARRTDPMVGYELSRVNGFAAARAEVTGPRRLPGALRAFALLCAVVAALFAAALLRVAREDAGWLPPEDLGE